MIKTLFFIILTFSTQNAFADINLNEFKQIISGKYQIIFDRQESVFREDVVFYLDHQLKIKIEGDSNFQAQTDINYFNTYGLGIGVPSVNLMFYIYSDEQREGFDLLLSASSTSTLKNGINCFIGGNCTINLLLMTFSANDGPNEIAIRDVCKKSTLNKYNPNSLQYELIERL